MADQRVALITGAGGGLGGAVARLLAEAGTWRLVLVDNRADALETSATDTRALGATTEVLATDLVDPASVERVVPWALDAFGRVDALVNAAAILHRRAFDDVTPDGLQPDLPHQHLRAVPPRARRDAGHGDRGWGRIVNVTSTGVYEGGFTMTSAIYEMSKGAVAVLTKMLSRHGAADGILVNTVCPAGCGRAC